MIQGTYVKGSEVKEIVYGNGLIELRPEEVEPAEPMKELHALFYFHPKREPQSHFLHNLIVILITVLPVFIVPVIGDFIQSDVVFSILCWATIAWVGFVTLANIFRR